MREIKKLSSGNVAAMTLSGKLTHSDYADIVAFLAKLIKKYKCIRVLIEFDSFEGWAGTASLDDIVFVFRYSAHIERMAFLVHAQQDKLALLLDRPFGRALGSNVKYFHEKYRDDAWKWVCDGAKDIMDLNFPSVKN
ncbi:MAG: STAS/SEC14 domain-containing protein [Puniceicoccales bacterium]|nr:STAS/SEC14 domain-containing protein [Puniceicoccales bacterium]